MFSDPFFIVEDFPSYTHERRWCLQVSSACPRHHYDYVADQGPVATINIIYLLWIIIPPEYWAHKQLWARCRAALLLLVLCSAPSVSQSVFTITEKAPSRAFCWLKALTSSFTFKTLLRHFAKPVLTPTQLLSWGTGAAFNQEKALVGALSVIVQLCRLIVNSTYYCGYAGEGGDWRRFCGICIR